MIVFQENGETVTFSPEDLTRNPPWPEKLLGFYFLAILIVLLVRLVQIIRCLWTLRKLGSAAQDEREKAWALGSLRARSLRRLAVLTFFLCGLEISLVLTNDLWVVGTEKVAHSWWLLVNFAQDLTAFNFGMVVCSLLYACGFFFESRLERRKLATDAPPARPATG